MKKIICLIAVVLCFTAATQAQLFRVDTLTTTSYGNRLDTVTNTASKSTTAYVLPVYKTGLTVQCVVTKISGTVGGTLGLYGSMNGTNFTLIGSTATPSDASANYSFNTTVGWKFYRVTYTGTGTMSASIKSYAMPY
ncbi:MAG: hypothetical protein EKK63_00285 [Acinetobacter sp.]|uniref:hypothetical protein n=1 Tax=Acinetobacter sp. TaxID=472 RepID=UPI000FBE3796|nr:hypothetical protein [Acinetobacter sp.]RUP42610.1 MAG: hypothetical protein EKK63_00285 [Acinetobacter sp.]